MERRRIALTIAAALLGLAPLSARAAPKPNVIVFLADDMGLGDTSVYLGKKLEASQPPIPVTLKMTNMERLAAKGTTFTSAYAPSSMCSTTRYALLTGRYAWRSTVKSNVIPSCWTSPQMVDPDRSTIANVFKNAGYDTSMFGKWHMGVTVADHNGNPYTNVASNENTFNNVRWPTAENPNVPTILEGPRQHGFDYWYGTVSSTDPIPGNIRGYFENETLQGVPEWAPIGFYGGMPVVPSFDISKTGEAVANKALDLIDAHAGVGGGPASDKPMFMYYASLDNHSIQTPPPSITLQGTTYPIRNQARLTNGFDQNIREDTVYQNDVVLGALLDKLQNTVDPQTGGPMIDNTLIILTSDNGADDPYDLHSAGLHGHKQEIYEGGVRVPFIAAWPGQIPQGATSDQVLGLNDLYASLSTIAGHSLGAHEAEDSENVLPALTGQTTAQFQRPSNLIVHDSTIGSATVYSGAALAIRSGKFKLVIARDLVSAPSSPGPNPGQSIPVALYDLSADWHEDNNLLNDPTYATMIAQMQQQALQYHNQGFSRTTIQTHNGPLLQTDGGADLANNVNGSVGYEFTVGNQPVLLTRLGMWDDGAGDILNQENYYPNPDGDTVGSPDGVAAPHWVRLFNKSSGLEIASVEITDANSTLDGEFRYVDLPASLALPAGGVYALTMSTAAADGDLFHTPAPFSGDAPISTSLLLDFQSRRSAADGAYPDLLPTGSLATGAAAESMYRYRFFVGPTATLVGFTPIVQSADFNNDGVVDGADFLAWQIGLGTTNAHRSDGDANGNGIVDEVDLQIWQQALVSQPAVPNAHGVPEPASCALMALALCALASTRRRSKP